MSNLITIFIPTFNRSKAVVQLLDEIASSSLINFIKVVVMDDGSSDDTYARLISRKYGKKITISRNKNNIGSAKGFLNFVQTCQTDYFMYMADDDKLKDDGIMELIPFLSNTKPDLVVTAWGCWDDDVLWKDTMRTINSNEKVKFKDIRVAMNHPPGVVFKTSEVAKHISIMRDRIENDCYATTMYPMVVLALLLAFSKNNCWWFKEVVGGYGPNGALSSNLYDNEGNTWDTLHGKWKEQKAFDEVYIYIYETTRYKWKEKALQLSIMHNLEFFSRIEQGIQSEKPELTNYFLMASAVKFLRNPGLYFRSVIKYLTLSYKFKNYMK
jgi:glycosyltransferase involved in cell wall biosynthesis